MGMEVIVNALMGENRWKRSMLNLVLGFVFAFLLAALPGKCGDCPLAADESHAKRQQRRAHQHGKKQGTPTMGGVLILFALDRRDRAAISRSRRSGRIVTPRRTTIYCPCC